MAARRGLLAAACATVLAAAPAAAQMAEVRAGFAAAGVPADPAAAAWQHAPGTRVDLMEQMIAPPVGGGAVRHVEVRALHDGEWLALRLHWEDASADRAVEVDAFRDAVAVGFPVDAGVPSPFMGDPEHPVTIWQWVADLDAEAAGEGAFDGSYPHTPGVWHFPQDPAVREAVHGWRGRDPVTTYTAVGFGTLERRATREVEGVGRHADGSWSVVLRRRLASDDVREPDFAPGGSSQLIVAVWDGAAREVNGRKSVTLSWIPFVLDEAEAEEHAHGDRDARARHDARD